MTESARRLVLCFGLAATAIARILATLMATGTGSAAAPGSRIPIPIGIWMDIGSIPRDSDGVRHTIDYLADIGIVDVYVQAFNRGLTIYPSEVAARRGLPAQRSAFAGFDPLAALVERAHERGVRVHAWLDVLYVGYRERGALLDRYPSWEMVARDGSRGYGPAASRQHWLSPAHPEARRFLQDLVGELVSRYEVDGVHLDYIRYPDPVAGDCGYEPDCARGFTEAFGIDPLTIDVASAELGDPRSLRELALWNAWRAAKVTELVAALATEVASRRPGVLVSAAVAPTGVPDGPYPGLLQDWPRWVRSGILDFVVPMTYTSRPEELRGLSRWTAFLLGEASPPACGVQMWKRTSPVDVVRQLSVLSEERAAGAVLFAQSYLDDDVALAVKAFLRTPATAQPVPPQPSAPTASTAPAGLPDPSAPSPAPAATIPFTRIPPLVDGDLSDEAWLDAAALSLCCDAMKPGRAWPGHEPEVRVVYDARGMYMAFSAVLTSAPAPARQQTTTHDGPVFYDDSFEVFVDPAASESLFFYFAFNVLGTRYDATRLRGPSYGPDWDVASRQENGIWQSEVFIPFEALGRRPARGEAGEAWRFNVCMNAPDSGRFVSWAPLPGIYAAPRHFGTISFAEARQAEAEKEMGADHDRQSPL